MKMKLRPNLKICRNKCTEYTLEKWHGAKSHRCCGQWFAFDNLLLGKRNYKKNFGPPEKCAYILEHLMFKGQHDAFFPDSCIKTPEFDDNKRVESHGRCGAASVQTDIDKSHEPTGIVVSRTSADEKAVKRGQ